MYYFDYKIIDKNVTLNVGFALPIQYYKNMFLPDYAIFLNYVV